MAIVVYTLWAALEEDPSGFWMMEARDEFSWEADPDACEAAFRVARDLAKRNGWVVREIDLKVPGDPVEAAFAPASAEAEVGATRD